MGFRSIFNQKEAVLLAQSLQGCHVTGGCSCGHTTSAEAIMVKSGRCPSSPDLTSKGFIARRMSGPRVGAHGYAVTYTEICGKAFSNVGTQLSC